MLIFKKFALKDRTRDANRVLQKYPNRIPIIVSSNTFKLDKYKYLVPLDITVGQFCYILRKQIHLGPEIAVFLLFNGRIPNSNTLMSNIYNQEKDKDGYLYCGMIPENTFGNNK
jgi:GABA(A) receptor-associated protein